MGIQCVTSRAVQAEVVIEPWHHDRKLPHTIPPGKEGEVIQRLLDGRVHAVFHYVKHTVIAILPIDSVNLKA